VDVDLHVARLSTVRCDIMVEENNLAPPEAPIGATLLFQGQS